MLLYFVAFDLSVVFSESMSPALQGTSFANGDCVLTEKISYRLRAPQRWEVVTFIDDTGLRVMKRVVGLPGEQIRLRRGQPLEIDGRPLDIPERLPYLHYIPYGNLADGKPVACGTGYYLLGDDSRDSNDSRFEGSVPRAKILGRAWLIVGPRPRYGFVN